ncbi:MAG: phosphate ABC transporter permease subunit PstC, partial [Jiangellaceae bacterium]
MTTLQRGPAVEPGPVSLRPAKNRVGERIIRSGLAAAAGISVITTLGIVVSLVVPALGFFREVDVWDFLTGTRWAPRFEPATFG